jgi:hypothetical protein
MGSGLVEYVTHVTMRRPTHSASRRGLIYAHAIIGPSRAAFPHFTTTFNGSETRSA